MHVEDEVGDLRSQERKRDRKFTQIKFDLLFILTLFRHNNFYVKYFCVVRYNKILIPSGHSSRLWKP